MSDWCWRNHCSVFWVRLGCWLCYWIVTSMANMWNGKCSFNKNVIVLERTRQENKAKGLAFLRAGNRTQALECFQKCVDITPEMALEVIKVRFCTRCEMEDIRNKTQRCSVWPLSNQLCLYAVTSRDFYRKQFSTFVIKKAKPATIFSFFINPKLMF